MVRPNGGLITGRSAFIDLTYGNHTNMVAVRGIGYSYNGIYYVQKVKHTISRGVYTQDFTLTREGLGSTITEVKP